MIFGKIRQNNRGQAMIEMAILGFFLILLVIIFTEYALFFLAAQKIEALGHETAQTAFYDCRLLTDAKERLVCLERVANNTKEILTRTLATSTPPTDRDFRIILTSWEVIGGTVQRTPSTSGSNNPVEVGILPAVSKYHGSADFENAAKYNLVKEINRIFTCEIFYRHQASNSGIRRSITFLDFTFSFPLLNNTIYTSSAS